MLQSPATFFMVAFIPPLYFLTRGKILVALINGFFYLIALFTILIGFGFPIWVFCVIHAAVYAQREATQLTQDRVIQGVSAQIIQNQERALQNKKDEF